jgi:hypothetical protein
VALVDLRSSTVTFLSISLISPTRLFVVSSLCHINANLNSVFNMHSTREKEARRVYWIAVERKGKAANRRHRSYC